MSKFPTKKKSETEKLRDEIAKAKANFNKSYLTAKLRGSVSFLIHSAMKKLSLTQKAVAEMTKKHEAQISQIVNDEKNVTLGMLVQVLAPLGIAPIVVDAAEYDKLLFIKQQVDRQKESIKQTDVGEATAKEAVTYATGTGQTEAAKYELVNERRFKFPNFHQDGVRSTSKDPMGGSLSYVEDEPGRGFVVPTVVLSGVT